MFDNLTPPSEGSPITMTASGLNVPNNPIMPFIEGDGTGPDIWRAARRVFDAAVKKAYAGEREISWFEVFAGQKSYDKYGTWLPDDTVAAFKAYVVGIKGPLTTPIGGGIRSLNVALRQKLDLYTCLRPVRYFDGVPSPVKRPELVDMVIFRENTEDIYAGVEWEAGTPEVKKVIAFLQDAMGIKNIRFPETSWYRRQAGFQRGQQAFDPCGHQIRAWPTVARASRFVHKGNIMKFTEGAFRDWGYELADADFADKTYTWSRWEITKKDKGEEAANAEQETELASRARFS